MLLFNIQSVFLLELLLPGKARPYLLVLAEHQSSSISGTPGEILEDVAARIDAPFIPGEIIFHPPTIVIRHFFKREGTKKTSWFDPKTNHAHGTKACHYAPFTSCEGSEFLHILTYLFHRLRSSIIGCHFSAPVAFASFFEKTRGAFLPPLTLNAPLESRDDDDGGGGGGERDTSDWPRPATKPTTSHCLRTFHLILFIPGALSVLLPILFWGATRPNMARPGPQYGPH